MLHVRCRTLQNYVVWWVLTTTNFELVSQKFQNLRKELNKVRTHEDIRTCSNGNYKAFQSLTLHVYGISQMRYVRGYESIIFT